MRVFKITEVDWKTSKKYSLADNLFFLFNVKKFSFYWGDWCNTLIFNSQQSVFKDQRLQPGQTDNHKRTQDTKKK